MKTRFIRLFAVLALLMAGPVFADVTIIANSGVPADTISKMHLEEIYLGKRNKWPDNSPIRYILTGDSVVHQAFLRIYLHRSPTQFEMHWRNMIFTGQGIKPLSLPSDQAVIDYVAATPGAVGYVSAPPDAANVKTITVN
ncbi:MAG: hypothetical protein SWH61_09590 [Thermodesulfobacteriota bacterium]|nr:hypothetical protein [Thermodesulfobacteriota bacterium]